jgi:hypothetical protein
MEHGQRAHFVTLTADGVVIPESDTPAELLGTLLEQGAVCETDELAVKRFTGDGETKLRPDAGRLAGAERDAESLQSLYST